MLESKRKKEDTYLDRRKALREVPSEKTKLETLEVIWSRQSHPAATAAVRGRHRLRLEKDEELVSPEALTSGESGGAGRVPSETNGGCGVAAGDDFYREHDGIMSDCASSGKGIPGRVSSASKERPSREVDDDPMSRTSQSATGLDGTVGVSSAPCRADSNTIEAQGVMDEALAGLAAAEQSLNSVESQYRDKPEG